MSRRCPRTSLPFAAIMCAVSVLAHAAEETDAPIQSVEITGAADNSFAAKKASVFKGTESIREIPQPVTVLTRQFLDDRLLPDLHDVMKNTPGVTVDYTDSERVGYYSRGFSIDALQIDGFTMNQSGSVFVQPDTAVLERVEILRGASGMLRGSGNPSAAVNLVRKRPTKSFQASLNLLAGTWDRKRGEADISGSLNAEGTLRGRVVLVKDEKDFFQKARHEDREVMYGVVEADLTPRTLLTATLQHTDLDSTGAWGNLPPNFGGSSLNLPQDTYLGAAWNRWNRYNDQATLELEHRFDNDWTLKLGAAYTGLHMKPWGFKQTSFSRTSTTNPYLVNVSVSAYSGDTSNQRVLSATANGPFQLFGRKHEAVFGVESQEVDTIGTSGYFGLGAMTNVDIRTWNPYTVTEPAVGAGLGTAYAAAGNKTHQQGAYATTRLSLADPLHLLVGARLSWWDYKVPATPASNYKVTREVTPFAGLTYDITSQINAYASYTEIFTPQNYKDASGSIIAPVRGDDYEAGFKGEFMGGRLTASLAAFRINNNGKAALDTSTPTPCLPYYPTSYCYVAGGKQRSEGYEAEISGEVLPGLQLMGGYTNTRTSYLSDSTAANVGQPLRSIDPRHLVRVFATYRPGGVLQGLSVGGGVQAQSETFVKSGTITAHQGGYTIFNAMLGYRFNKTYALQVNANNLFDKFYFAKYAATGFSNYYGDPRNVQVSLRVTL
ncbi:TonB-dependent siderophore receptor [Duganella sp. CY42W]|uniref:TonB-dependent siderophore receptor n=2 Tax=Duganella levis TaxID=2692169 RepID=A0ABW9VUL8_9BURK|nr:TonB-dependent siderophore receptor [Duganella levis]